MASTAPRTPQVKNLFDAVTEGLTPEERAKLEAEENPETIRPMIEELARATADPCGFTISAMERAALAAKDHFKVCTKCKTLPDELAALVLLGLDALMTSNFGYASRLNHTAELAMARAAKKKAASDHGPYEERHVWNMLGAAEGNIMGAIGLVRQTHVTALHLTFILHDGEVVDLVTKACIDLVQNIEKTFKTLMKIKKDTGVE